MAWGDVDGDGDLDLAAGFRAKPTEFYLNQGGSLLKQDWTIEANQVTEALAWGDVDGDGDLDLAVGSINGPTRIFPNVAGVIQQAPQWVESVVERTKALAWGDMNGDGFLDLVAGNFGRPSRIYLNNGDGTLSADPAWVAETTAWTTDLALADFDGDGALDLAVGNNATGEHAVVYRNIRGDALTMSRVWESSGNLVTDIAWGDVDEDGFPELALVDYTLDDVRADGIYQNENGALNTTSTWQPVDAVRSTSLVWGDVDGDSDLDLVIGSSADSTERVYINQDGALQNTPAWQSADTSHVTDLALVDVDRDTDLDLVAIYSGSIYVYTNRQWPLDSVADWNTATPGVRTMSIAWGDADNDGFLDLAMGNGDPFASVGSPNVIYHNNRGLLDSADLLYSAPAADITTSVAWGDMDGDGWLDLAVGNLGEPSYVLLNQNGSFNYDDRLELGGVDESGRTLRTDDHTRSVAWGDVDRDGDLDLAVGNEGQANRLYINENGALRQEGVLTFGADTATYSLAWGDIDGDGDLDLAAGNFGAANQIYFNLEGRITDDVVQIFGDDDNTTSVVWGDINSDGLPDLVVGNAGDVNKYYPNIGGLLLDSPLWVSLDQDDTRGLALGDVDGDGDLDLAAANAGGLDGAAAHPDKIYINERGQLQTISDFPWRAKALPSYAVAWVDLEGDGDLDLMTGSGPTTGRTTNLDGSSQLYLNERFLIAAQPQGAAIIFGPESSPVTTPTGGSYTLLAPAALNAQAGIREDGLVPISYTLQQPDNEPVRAVRGYYSLDGGGSWFIAQPTGDTQTTNLSTTPGENEHVFNWDVFASNLYGQSDNVVFRLEAYATPPADIAEEATTGAYLYTNQAAVPQEQPFVAANTRPFRVRGNQVRVLREVAGGEPQPVAGALVYKLAEGQTAGGSTLPDDGLVPFTTDAQGNLLGRTVLQPAERLVALWPVPREEVQIPFTEQYTLYYMSAEPDESEGLAMSAAEPVDGELPLIVSERNPLILFHLDFSLEWDARQDDLFMLDLATSIQRASETLFDVTNGQAAIGNVRVFHNRHYWNNVDVVVLANNGIRPSAAIGGVVRQPVSETLADETTVVEQAYWPGQVRMGPGWDPFGESTADLGQDWQRALAHELAHYLLFLPDNYLGFEVNGALRRINCQGSFMTSTYDPAYSEFLTEAQWSARGGSDNDCQRSLAEATTGRADWQTVTNYYPMLNPPDTVAASGPGLIPINLTHVFSLEPAMERQPMPARNFDVRDAGSDRLRLPDAQGYLIDNQGTTNLTDDVLIALGAPTAGGDRLKVRGAHAGDRLCVFGFGDDVPYAGCIDALRASDVSIELEPVQNPTGGHWEPQIAIEPVDRTTLDITVVQPTDGSAQILAQVYLTHYASAPCNFGLSPVVTLARDGSRHTGRVELKWEDYAVAVRLWTEGGQGQESIAYFILDLPPGNLTVESESGGAAEPDSAESEECDAPGEASTEDLNSAAGSYLAYYLPAGGTNNTPLGGPNNTPLGGPNNTPLGGTNNTPLGGPNNTPLGGTNNPPLGGTNNTPLGGTNNTPLGGPNNTPLGGAQVMLLGGTNNTPLGGTNNTPLGGANAILLGSTNNTPLGGTNNTPLGGTNNTPLGGVETRPAFAPALSTDGQVVIYNQAGYFEDNGVQEIQVLATVPGRASHPWLKPVGQAHHITFDPLVTDPRFLAYTYLQRDVPDGYEYALSIYFLPDGGSEWERVPTELYVENLAVAELQETRDGVFALMATVGVPQLQAGWNIFGYPLPVARDVEEALANLSGIALALYPVQWNPDGSVVQPPDYCPGDATTCTELTSSVSQLLPGGVYWIYVTEPVTLYFAPPERTTSGEVR